MTTNPPPASEETAAQPPRRRRVMRRVQVTRVTPLSPRMVCVTFTGDDLAAFGWNGPAAHIKLIFPEEGETEAIMPDPDGPRSTHMRTYTPRRFDPNIPELDVEFVLHGEGPASTWAAQAQVGQVLILGGPGPNYQIDPEADWFLLAGDDAALPAIATILEALPAKVPVQVLLEVADEAETRPLTTAAQLTITWLYLDPDPAKADVALETALRNVELPASKGRIYVGCESTAVRRIRKHLLEDRSLDPATIVTRGYWKLGNVNHTDHDYGTDH